MTYASPYPNYPYSLYTQPSYTPYTAPQQQSAQQAAQPGQTGIIWVDGEVGAKAYQLPQGWPANTPMPLWDTNDTIIYLKSTNPMGMPNPLQKIYYRMEETQQTSGAAFRSAAPALMSGEAEAKTEVAYVTRDDLERMKEELRESITEVMTSAQTAQTAPKRGGKNEPSV